MEVKAITRNLRISVRKARPIARRVQGLKLSDALAVADFSPLKAARFLAATLRSAAANAQNNNGAVRAAAPSRSRRSSATSRWC